MLLTIEGSFDKDRFVPNEPITIPEHAKVIVTVLTPMPTPILAKEEDHRYQKLSPDDDDEEEFFRKLFKDRKPRIIPPQYTGPITDEFLGKPFISTKGWKFNREEANER